MVALARSSPWPFAPVSANRLRVEAGHRRAAIDVKGEDEAAAESCHQHPVRHENIARVVPSFVVAGTPGIERLGCAARQIPNHHLIVVWHVELIAGMDASLRAAGKKRATDGF